MNCLWRYEMNVEGYYGYHDDCYGPLMPEFFTVADYMAFNDPAVRSYLVSEYVSSEGRQTIVD